MFKIIIKNMVRRIEILRRFLPVLLNDITWYDYSSILQLQLTQLKYMEDHWVRDTSNVNDHKIKKDIHEAIILTQRLLDDDYTGAPWRDIIMNDSPFDDDREWEKFRCIPFEHDDHQRKQDLDRLYSKILSKKITTWWD